MQLGLIGAGNLGEAMLKGIGEALGPIMVSERSATRARQIAERYDVTTGTIAEVMQNSDTVILAIKPGQMSHCLGEVAPALTQQHLIISVAAGVPLSKIAMYLGAERQLVRVMPNTPAAVGQGVTAIYHAAGDPLVLATVRSIFSCIGDVVEVSDEKWFDAITALSGSGPAYICLMLEALIEGGVKAGLPRQVSQQLALSTLKGTAALIESQGGDAVTVRHGVTSPGGTTAHGLAALESRAVRAAFIEAVQAATNRGRELAGD